MTMSSDENLRALEQAIGYCFTERRLLFEALTHRSFGNEAKGETVRDNERLEFFGDALLSFCVSRELLDRFPESREGVLTRARASLVDEQTLAACASAIGLGQCLRLGRGESRSGGREKRSILADAYEALLAAIYLDGGLEPVRRLVVAQFTPLMSDLPGRTAERDAKTELQELAQSRHGSTPEYRLKEVTGPDHELLFTVTVHVGGKECGEGRGSSKKGAEQEAAASGMARLREEVAAGKG
jgi:ribonuclease-3